MVNHAPSDITIPLLGNDDLCPVSSIRSYMEVTKDSSDAALFLHLKSGKPLNAAGVSYWLAKAIRWLLPLSKGKGHDIRKLSTSMA